MQWQGQNGSVFVLSDALDISQRSSLGAGAASGKFSLSCGVQPLSQVRHGHCCTCTHTCTAALPSMCTALCYFVQMRADGPEILLQCTAGTLTFQLTPASAEAWVKQTPSPLYPALELAGAI